MAVGGSPHDVDPNDIALAAEYHAQGMDPAQAFQDAVILNAVSPSPEQTFSEIFKTFDKDQLEAFTEACEHLDIALEEGTRQFYKRSGDGGRAAAILQLEAVINFVEELKLGGPTHSSSSDASFRPVRSQIWHRGTNSKAAETIGWPPPTLILSKASPMARREDNADPDRLQNNGPRVRS